MTLPSATPALPDRKAPQERPGRLAPRDRKVRWDRRVPPDHKARWDHKVLLVPPETGDGTGRQDLRVKGVMLVRKVHKVNRVLKDPRGHRALPVRWGPRERLDHKVRSDLKALSALKGLKDCPGSRGLKGIQG